MSLLLLKQRGFVRGGLVAYYDFRNQNLLAFSEEFENAVWNPTLVSTTPDVAPAPDGSLTADLLTPTGTKRVHSPSSGCCTEPRLHIQHPSLLSG